MNYNCLEYTDHYFMINKKPDAEYGYAVILSNTQINLLLKLKKPEVIIY